MEILIVLLSIVAVSYCQIQYPETETRRWPGPFANHKLGENVKDTPEVAKAKAEFDNYYRSVLAVLPELPPKERYIAPPEEYSIPSTKQNVYQQNKYNTFSQKQPEREIKYTAPVTVERRDWNQELESVNNQPPAKVVTTVFPVQQPIVPPSQTIFVPPHVQQIPYQTDFPVASRKPIYSEDIPRSPFGETPEVARARQAHFAAIAEARASLLPPYEDHVPY